MPTPSQLAALHATAFDGAARWSAGAFARALRDPLCFFLPTGGDLNGFALGRVVLDEAELMTLVVARSRRGRGRGRALLSLFEAEARRRGAAAAFLEVRADNDAARALYVAAGWAQVGLRPGYYDGIDAALMRKPLGEP